MTTRAERLSMAAMLIAFGVVAVVGAAVAGAASTSSPLPDLGVVQPVDPPSEPEENEPPAPKRYSAIGVIVGIREQRLAVRVKSREQPVLVALRPATALRLNRKPASLNELRVGDKVVIVGRPGPRGNVIFALGVNVLRAPESST